MKKTVHILPLQEMGGAELAALSAAQAHSDLSVFFLKGSSLGWLHPKTYRDLIRHIDQSKAEVAVFSLWKTAIAMLIVRIFRPSVRRIMFLHSDRSIHLPDRIFSSAMARLSHRIFADSNSAARRFLSERPRVISFVMNRLQGKVSRVGPQFIFWGRLTVEKNLEAALKTFSLILTEYPDARFSLIGPDGGAKAALQKSIAQSGLSDCVTLLGQKSHSEIAKIASTHSFYLQPSLYEGMAMSVVEAMQLGLVVVAAPVGEISSYLSDAENGIVFTNPEHTAQRIIAVLKDTNTAQKISHAAIEHWKDAPLYADDFATAISEGHA